MLCSKCAKKPTCHAPCSRLAAHLKSLEVSQKELLFAPEKLAQIAEHRLFTWPELMPGEEADFHAGGWRPSLDLPPELLLPLSLHLFEDWTPERIARRLKVHPATVRRRLRRAALVLKERIEASEAGFQKSVREGEGR